MEQPNESPMTPDPDAAWGPPADTDAERARWQGAIDAALADGTLELRRSTTPFVLTLTGSCPRCGHPMTQTVERDVPRGFDAGGRTGPDGAGRRPVVEVRLNVDCTCPSPHPGRPDGRLGCGWGGPLPVTLRTP